MLNGANKPMIMKRTAIHLDNLSARTYEALCHLFGVQENPQHLEKLRVIFQSAVDVHRILCAQKAQFRFEIPPFGTITAFNTSHMTGTLGEENEELNGRIVHFATFPQVVKYGDERGENVRKL